MHTFSAAGAISAGWHVFKKRPWFFIGVSLFIAFLSWAIGFFAGIAGALFAAAYLGAVIQFAASVAGQVLLSMGSISFYLLAHERAEEATWHALWHPKPFWKFVGTSLITVAVAAVVAVLFVLAAALIFTPLLSTFSGAPGLQILSALVVFVLLAVPALIPVVLLLFSQYFVIDHGYSPVDAVRASVRATREHFWQLMWLLICAIVLNILGILFFFVGVLATSAVTGLAFVDAYRMLSARVSHGHHPHQ